LKLGFGSDHAGLDLRHQLESWAKEKGHEVHSFGAMSPESYDYPDAADALCRRLLEGKLDFGILICGSGIGISIRANRHLGIRAALCTSPLMAELSRQHNHANVLCLGARITEPDVAKECLDAFLCASPDLGERHVRRIVKLDS